MVDNILVSVLLLYFLLTVATLCNYKWRFKLFGSRLPQSFNTLKLVTIGPVVLIFVGVLFSVIGMIFLSPILLYVFGYKWAALFCLFGLVYLTKYTALFSVNGIMIKFGFPYDIPIGLLVLFIVGVWYSAIGAILLSPILLLIYL